MSSSSLSSSSCSCTDKLCFCELTSPLFMSSTSSPSPSPPSKQHKVISVRNHDVIPGCFCFRCEMIREEDDEDFYRDAKLEEVDEEEDYEDTLSILEVDEVSEHVKSSCLITSLCVSG